MRPYRINMINDGEEIQILPVRASNRVYISVYEGPGRGAGPESEVGATPEQLRDLIDALTEAYDDLETTHPLPLSRLRDSVRSRTQPEEHDTPEVPGMDFYNWASGDTRISTGRPVSYPTWVHEGAAAEAVTPVDPTTGYNPDSLRGFALATGGTGAEPEPNRDASGRVIPDSAS